MRKRPYLLAGIRPVAPPGPLLIALFRKAGEIQRDAESVRMDVRHPYLLQRPAAQLHPVQLQTEGFRLDHSGGGLHLQSGHEDLAVLKRHHHARFSLDFHARAPRAERHDPLVDREQRRDRSENQQEYKDAGRPENGFQESAQRRPLFCLFRFGHEVSPG